MKRSISKEIVKKKKKKVPVNKTKVRERLYSVGDRNSCGVKMCASEGLLLKFCSKESSNLSF